MSWTYGKPAVGGTRLYHLRKEKQNEMEEKEVYAGVA